jgi:predicted ATPase
VPDTFIRRLRLDSLLSFSHGGSAIELQPLNVLIGPNGSGKSNLIEALEILRATATDFATAIRRGGGAEEWLWKGARRKPLPATVNVEVASCPVTRKPLRYWLEFDAVSGRVEILTELIEDASPSGRRGEPSFYYRFPNGEPVLNARSGGGNGRRTERKLERASLIPDQSVLAQRKDPDLYPEVTWLGQQFDQIQTFREWTFGANSELRAPQRADNPTGRLLSDASNLALMLNEIQHRNSRTLDEAMKRFLPRYERLSVRIVAGTVQFFLHETGLKHPVVAARLSDGTLRLLAMLAVLLAPTPPPLLCLEEPELGLHPDALSLMAELLVDASSRMQLVVTTHSDALLSALTDRMDAVMVCENDGNGTTIERLDAGRLAFWLKKYKLGEIWRIGEIGGNP